MAEPVQLEQPTGDLKAPQKTSSLFFEPSVSFDTISDPREGSQSLVIWLYKLKLQASLPRLKNKCDKFSNTTSVGKNWDFNQMHGCFMLPPPSLFFNYALLSPELEITVGHRTFSVHIAQMSKHSIICADIMSRHSLQQKLSCSSLQPQLITHSG